MPKKADTKKSTAKKQLPKKHQQRKHQQRRLQLRRFQLKGCYQESTCKEAPAKKVPAKKAPAKKIASRKRTTPISSYKGRKGEKYMSAAMKKHFNAVLIEWREHLREEMQKTFDHLKIKVSLMQIQLIEHHRKKNLPSNLEQEIEKENLLIKSQAP